MHKLKKLLILLLFLISFQLVYAVAEIDIKDTPIRAVILPGQSPVFDLEITNMQSSTDEIKAVIIDENWRRESGNQIYNLNAKQSSKDRLSLFPVGNLKPGVYSINIRFVSLNNPEIYTDKQLIVTIVDYKTALDAKLETNPQGIDPRKDNLVKLNLKANYNINLEDLNVHIENSLFTKDINSNVNGLETKSEEFIVSLDPNTKEGDYDTRILVKFGNEVLVNKIERITVSSYSNLKETKTEESNFLKKTTTITRLNDGNSLSQEIYTVTLSGWQKLFTKFTPDPTKIEQTKQGFKYEWRFNLQPGEDYQIISVTNYRTSLFFIILILLLIYFGYMFLFTELAMTKKVLTLKSQEGGIAGVKVLLYIKNNGPTIKNLHIVDEIPSSLEMPHEYMTLKPTSIRKGTVNSTIVWEIPELIKGEERVISYKLKSKTSYKGRLIIPKAVCRYKNNVGKISVSSSNEIIVHA